MNDTNQGVGTPANNIAGEPGTSSPDPTQSIDITKNLKAEMNRKFSKINEKIDQLLTTIAQPKVQPVVETDEDAPEYKRYIDTRLKEAEKAEVQKAQQDAWGKAVEMFPELDPNAENFDEKFYKLADKYYSDYDLSKVKDAPYRAVREAALDLGKIEQLTKEKLLKDEARRSRIIAEGASSPRENKKEKEPNLNERGLARLGINPDKLKARMKANKDKYGAQS